MGGMASTVASSIRLSWMLAADRVTASGMPLASMTTWRFEPGLPRSVGFGPVSRPPLYGAFDVKRFSNQVFHISYPYV